MSRAKEQNHSEGNDDDFVCIANVNDDQSKPLIVHVSEQKQPNVARQEFHEIGLNANITEGENHTIDADTDDDSDEEEKKSSSQNSTLEHPLSNNNHKTMHASKDEALSDFLSLHNIHETLYSPLLKQDIRLEHLESIEMNDLNELCIQMKMTITDKIKLKTAVQLLQKEQNMIANGKINIVLIGDSGVGKTCLMVKYTRHKFYDEVATSIGISSASKKIQLEDDYVMELNIWDTAGQEKYNSICTNYYRRADVIMLCYSVDSQRSLANCEKWRQQIDEHANEDVCVMLIGCKKDVYRRQLSETKAKELLNNNTWKKYNAWWAECSAQTGENIDNVFTTAAKIVRTKRKGMKQPRQFQANPINNQRRKRRNNNNNNRRNDADNSCCF